MIRIRFGTGFRALAANRPGRPSAGRETPAIRGRKLVPTLDGSQLEGRAMLSGFGGGNFDFSRPFVKNSALPAANINFTSHTYHQIEISIGGVAATIAKNIDNPQVVSDQLGKVASRVPFGLVSLRPILVADLQALKDGPSISTADASTALTATFQRVLGRAPDANALAFGIPAIQGGTTVRELTTLLVTSPEFLSNNTTDTSSATATRAQYVTALYKDILGRAPDAPGLTFWEGQLASGIGPTLVATAFVNSNEAATSPTSIFRAISDPTPTDPTFYFGAASADGSLPGPFRGTSNQALIADLIFSDLSAYLDQGEGTTFNVLRSRVNHSTDVYLTFNGRVG